MKDQSPSGGCVLKQYGFAVQVAQKKQSPSGGCVLKLY